MQTVVGVSEPDRRGKCSSSRPPQYQQGISGGGGGYDFLHYHRGKPLSESAPAFRFRGQQGRQHGQAGEGADEGSLLLCNIRPQVCGTLDRAV